MTEQQAQSRRCVCVVYTDVWVDDGDWIVNNARCVEEDIWIDDDMPDEEIIDLFKEAAGIRPDKEVVLVEYGPGVLEFELTDGYPLGRFEWDW